MEGEKFTQEGLNLLQGFKDFCTNVIFENIPRIIIALIILFVGWKLIKVLTNFLHKIFTKKNIDNSLQSFLHSLISIALKTLLVITVADMIGIQMTSFIAILGAAGLAVGMALQGTLQNFAGGVIILILKPYRVGDFIDQGGVSGTVTEIQIFNTVLTTLDNKVIIVPNTQLATNTLVNYTRSGKRRVDIPVGIAYGANIDEARRVLLEYAQTIETIYKEGAEAPVVVCTGLGASSVDLELRVWSDSALYAANHSKLTQGVYETLGAHNIDIPFNQLQVHINKD